uniref:EGF-like domain-containing protein n=1 Tax=Strigamia maritima TaxID=126957 RepID=T1IUN5_STRMM
HLPAPARIICADGKLVRSAQVCDGVLDCVDGADENNFTLCDTKPRTCTRDEFTCANQKCVPIATQCNREDDCGDWSDELGCNAEGSCSDRLCEHFCISALGNGNSFLCQCAPGFKVGSDHRSCEDIDECKLFHVNRCPQLCENSVGSFNCHCKMGFVWSQYRCLAGGPPPSAVYAVGSRLVKLRRDHTLHYFIQSETSIRAIDIDPIESKQWTAKGEVYWVDADNLLKRSLVPDFSPSAPDWGQEQVLTESEMRTSSIAVDWIARNLYWAKVQNKWSSKHGHIAVTTLDGRYRKILIRDNVQQPFGLTVAPEVGKLVWSDIGCFPRLEVAWMDGTHRLVLVHTGLARPTGVTIDHHMKQRVFWCDSLLNRLESVNLDGTDRALIANLDALEHPIRLDLFGLTLFWSTNNTNKLIRLDKFGRGSKVTVTTHARSILDFRVYHPQKQNLQIENPCAKKICSHLCLLNPVGASCACPEGSNLHRYTKKICDAAVEPAAPALPRCNCKTDEICKLDIVSLTFYCD